MAIKARYISADATPLERFQIGDTVAHISHGDGIVTANDGNVITIKYERRYSKTIVVVGGKNIVQNYDANFFKNNPRLIFHRGDIAKATPPVPGGA